MGDGWQFNEEDMWPEEPAHVPEPGPPEPADDLLRGQDPQGIVTVYVTETGEVRATKLAADWKRGVDPRSLATPVVAAANSATLRAANRQAEIVQSASVENQTQPAGGSAAPDESPITTAEALRLIETVTTEVDAFMRKVSEVAGSTASAESRGRHVRGTAKQGQIVEITIDASWCSSARNPEVENELTEVLQALCGRSSAAELADGPQSPAIAQLQEWASDPQRLFRRIGLVPNLSNQHSGSVE